MPAGDSSIIVVAARKVDATENLVPAISAKNAWRIFALAAWTVATAAPGTRGGGFGPRYV